MALAGLCPEPALLGFALPGLEGMKQPQGLDGLCGEGAAWEHWLVGAALFFLVDLEAPVQPQSLSVQGMCVGSVCSQRGNSVCLGSPGSRLCWLCVSTAPCWVSGLLSNPARVGRVTSAALCARGCFAFSDLPRR